MPEGVEHLPDEFEKLSTRESYEKLESSPSGLSSTQVGERLEKYGKNEVVEKRDNGFLKFLKKFWAPVPWMLELL